MLYIPCVEFQFCIHYIQLPFEKNGYLRFPRGGKTLARGGECPPPKWNPAHHITYTIHHTHIHTMLYRNRSLCGWCLMSCSSYMYKMEGSMIIRVRSWNATGVSKTLFQYVYLMKMTVSAAGCMYVYIYIYIHISCHIYIYMWQDLRHGGTSHKSRILV